MTALLITVNRVIAAESEGAKASREPSAQSCCCAHGQTAHCCSLCDACDFCCDRNSEISDIQRNSTALRTQGCCCKYAHSAQEISYCDADECHFEKGFSSFTAANSRKPHCNTTSLFQALRSKALSARRPSSRRLMKEACRFISRFQFLRETHKDLGHSCYLVCAILQTAHQKSLFRSTFLHRLQNVSQD